MRFYKLTAETDKRLLPEEKKKGKPGKKNSRIPDFMAFRERLGKYAEKVRTADDASAEEKLGRDEVFINFSSVTEQQAVLIMATAYDGEGDRDLIKRFRDYLSGHDYEGRVLKCEEITGKTYRFLLNESHRQDFIGDYDETIKRYGFFKHTHRNYDFSFSEYILPEGPAKYEDMLAKVSEMQTVPSLGEEMERIYSTPRRRWRPGNPVHYVLAADEGKYRNDYFMLLLNALYACKRICCRRFSEIDYEEICDSYDRERLDEVYRLQTGGVLVFNIRKETMQDSDYLTGGESRAKEICKMAANWKNKVLTVFLFPRDSEKLQNTFLSDFVGVPLITITETIVFDKEAKAFLRKFARENELCTYPGLTGYIQKGVGYSKIDLGQIFENWYDAYLRERVFPQYSTKAIVMTAAEKKAKGMGIDRLNELIGLAETKALITEILDFAKAQNLYSFGEARAKQSLHMIFSGNPGTAKTTVARLVAQILKENEVLSNGDLIEVGRSDLVGKYVGHTAPLVKANFERAKGSVLFIDEAYSLVDDRDGCYGDEAISTIVQEMENCRDEVVVIFAGYPDKMEGFLKKNPGLRSRIGFHVAFPDYSPDELYEILVLLANDNRMKLAPGVQERVLPLFNKAVGTREFGNGRYARNLLEKARLRQATRLIHMEHGKVTEQIATTLIAEDFEELRLTAMQSEKRVGFV